MSEVRGSGWTTCRLLNGMYLWGILAVGLHGENRRRRRGDGREEREVNMYESSGGGFFFQCALREIVQQ